MPLSLGLLLACISLSPLKILDWLIDEVRLVKPMNEAQYEELMRNFPKYCQSGVMFADLINRLSGKEEVIKGISRNP